MYAQKLEKNSDASTLIPDKLCRWCKSGFFEFLLDSFGILWMFANKI
jgi:hypothetical protein